MKRSSIPLFCAVLAMPMTAFADPPKATAAPAPPAAPAAPVPLDSIVAIVDDAVFFRSDVVARMHRLEPKLDKDPVKRREQQKQLFAIVVHRLIDEVLVLRDAARLQIEAADAEVDKGIDMVAAQNKMDRKTLENEVKNSGYSIADYHDEIRKQILEEKWLLTRATTKIDRSKYTTPQALDEAFERQREIILEELRAHAFIEVR